MNWKWYHSFWRVNGGFINIPLANYSVNFLFVFRALRCYDKRTLILTGLSLVFRYDLRGAGGQRGPAAPALCRARPWRPPPGPRTRPGQWQRDRAPERKDWVSSGGTRIDPVSLLVIQLIWIGYITRLSQWGREGVFNFPMVITRVLPAFAAARGVGRQHSVVPTLHLNKNCVIIASLLFCKRSANWKLEH